jgi:hypothetical protein
LIGRGTVETGSLSFWEGVRFMKSLGSMATRAIGFIVDLFAE